MPVRVKQRALLQQCASTLDKLRDELKLGIIALLLAWNQPIVLKLRDIQSNKCILLNSNGQSLSLPRRDQDFEPSKALGAKIASLLSQTGYFDSLNLSEWVPASVTSRDISIKGVIRLSPVPTKQFQYLSLGVKPLERSNIFNHIYDRINKLFKASDFGMVSEQNPDDLNAGSAKSKFGSIRSPNKAFTVSRKGIEKWPSFYLKISVKAEANVSLAEIMDEEDVMSRMIEVLETLIETWLLSHHFRPTKVGKSGSNISPVKLKELSRIPAKLGAENGSVSNGRLLQHLSEPTIQWNNDKSQLPVHIPIQSTHSAEAHRSFMSRGSSDLNPSDSPASCIPLGSVPPKSSTTLNNVKNLSARMRKEETDEMAVDETLFWTDPYTKKTYMLNARTGMALNPVDGCSPIRYPLRRLTLNKPNSNLSTQPPQWMEDISKTWRNLVFANAQQAIPRVVPGNMSAESHSVPLTIFDRADVKVANQFGDGVSFSSKTRLTKDSLRDSRVITQVNRQFILLSVPKEGESKVLVAVDQHAADERCRVEQLFHDLCLPPQHEDTFQSDLGYKSSIDHLELTKALHFQLPLAEIRRFEQQASYFAQWGILYNITSKSNLTESKSRDLIVKTLPKVIAERVRLDPQILITLLREEMWKRTEDGSKPQPAMTFNESPGPMTADSKHWLQQIGRCPKGIIDLLNSRACRSAIMFNDSLTNEECEALVQRVTDCAFPFQCAHGRPSMIPLIEVSSEAFKNENEPSFANAFRAWKDKEKSVLSIDNHLFTN
jgi:DNA mismatch repair protein MLH3